MSDRQGIPACPACAAPTKPFLDWKYSGFEGSIFNYTAHLHCCPACGLVHVHNIDDSILARFYVGECAYADGPFYEVTAPVNQDRYAFYADFLYRHAVTPVPMADVGCNQGGFLSRLVDGGWNESCWGVDVDIERLPTQTRHRNIAFRDGGCMKLPFEDDALGLLTYFHVIEHIRDLSGLMTEAGRVLREDGYILIEVPDEETCATEPVTSAFWMCSREHVNHFTARALGAALHRHGFTVVDVARQILEAPYLVYPSLIILARKTATPLPQSIPIIGDVAAYAEDCQRILRRQAEQISALASGGPVTVWGCTPPFFSLLPMLEGHSIRVCDASPRKQGNRWRGLPVEDPAVLPAEGVLVIASSRYGAEIKAAARTLGWADKSIYTLP